MKARTKGQKLRRRRGRPAIEDVSREPNGRISRSSEPADIVALSARVRHLGVSMEQARDQLAATFIGRLHLNFRAWQKTPRDERRPVDSLSQAEYEAAKRYRELHDDHLRVIGARDAIYDGSPGKGVPDEASDLDRRIMDRYDAAKRAVRDAQEQNRHANLWAALQYCVLRDEGFPHMVGDLRIVCHAIAKHFKLEGA